MASAAGYRKPVTLKTALRAVLTDRSRALSYLLLGSRRIFPRAARRRCRSNHSRLSASREDQICSRRARTLFA